MSLVEIATYDEHFIVDVIELKEDISVLNEVFTNPEILKVIHGCDWDLDRLFMVGLYVINLFDPQIAANKVNTNIKQALFVGSSADLHKLLKNKKVQKKEDENIQSKNITPEETSISDK